MKINWTKVWAAVESALLRLSVAAAIGAVYFVQQIYTHWTFNGAQFVILILGYFLPDAEKWLTEEAQTLNVPVPPQPPQQ
jgi:hypothetical protein